MFLRVVNTFIFKTKTLNKMKKKCEWNKILLVKSKSAKQNIFIY